ncbi:HAD family hydrolase [Methanocella arvoryzae]|uniref:Hydrolase (Haloacid dehalogenase-like) n=1 Tax=Methanocella arvoryzae (strain DSM 22066 / NBRC 105507 / MRE50) TaxID=351160 RepID=Q0W946_METAR|nr:HAD family hydrolase [Methanocella arvoryzae]CAJ35171.1 putative hydrolase (haloacid dehalogenase-like) [Methanocella arvoryzae MRE50]
MKTAVIFDSAGTLLKAYRVAKNVRSGEIVENVASTNMVLQHPGCALVAIRADSADFLDNLDASTTISTFLASSSISLDVICRRSKCTTERIASAAKKDTLATIGDMRDAVAAVKLKCKDIYYVNMGFVVDVPRSEIPYVLATGGRLFSGARRLIQRLGELKVDVYIASGDNRKSLSALSRELGLPESRAYDALSPAGKKELVLKLREKYDLVVMVGDGINDYQAIEAADIGVLTVQQAGPRPQVLYDSADFVIDDIGSVEEVISRRLPEGK